MDIGNIEKFSELYKAGQRMGASILLREFLGLPADYVIPLSIAHGVDIFQWKEPIDVYKAEPIHWAYNSELCHWSASFKRTVLLPHPWAIVHSMRGLLAAGRGDLVVAPPSSPANDLALYKLLKDRGYKNYSVLVKARGGEDDSVSFWSRMGVNTVSAGSGDDGFYFRLYETLSQFDRIIGCNVSSALFFAASIGKPLELITDYEFRAYQRPDYLDAVNFSSSKSKEIVRVLVEEGDALRSSLSRDLLGFSLLSNAEQCRTHFTEALGELTSYFHPPRSKIFSGLLGNLALYTGRPGFVNLSWGAIYSEFIVRKMYEMKINEFALWLDGPNERNLSLEMVRPKGGVTVGGRGF